MKFFLILFVLGLLLRYLLPLVLRFAVKYLLKKQARKFSQAYGANPFENPAPTAARSASTGNVQVAYVPPREKPRPPKQFNGGEYVDFEEVK